MKLQLLKSEKDLTDASLPSRLYPYGLWLASTALIAHLIEGAIAAWKASSCHKNFITYGIYTLQQFSIG